MSNVMQNIFYGIKIPSELLTDEQMEEVINDSNTKTFYNGNSPMGDYGTLLGIEIQVLSDSESFNLDKFFKILIDTQ